MKKVNLRDLYPDVYKNDYFVEVTEDVLETIRAAERAEAAYDRRMYRYKAYYSLDCDNGIENAILMKPQTPEMLLEEKQLREQLYAAVMALPEKQAKRIYARYYLGMEKLITRKEAAEILGISIATLDAARNNGLISYVQYVQNGCVYFTAAGLQEYIAKCTHRAKPVERSTTYRKPRSGRA